MKVSSDSAQTLKSDLYDPGGRRMIMKCAICGMTVGLADERVDHDWIPFFYEGDEGHGPACAGCCESLLQIGEDGEMEVRAYFRGKIAYQDEPEEEDDDYEYLLMGMIFN
jgi:hypothetical protein